MASAIFPVLRRRTLTSTASPRDRRRAGEEIPLPSITIIEYCRQCAHPTTDLLVGRDQVVVTRRTNVAISRLTDDFLDTSGILYTFEGELEAEADMMLLQAELGMFDWTVPETFAETGAWTDLRRLNARCSRPTLKWRAIGSRSTNTSPVMIGQYSLACALDGECPVNFASQVSDYADEQWLQNEAFFQEWRATYAST